MTGGDSSLAPTASQQGAGAAPDRGVMAGAPGMRWLKAFYLLVFASYGTTSIYVSLYYRRVGLPNTQIGLLIALQPLVMLVAGPLWSLLADWLRMRDRLLTAVAGLSILPMLGMIWVHSFGGLIMLSGLSALFMGPVQPLMDSMTLTVLGEGQRHRYSEVRAFGSIGYAPIMWLTGMFLQSQDIRWIFVANAVFMAAACLLSLRMRLARTTLPVRIGVGLGTMVRDRAWLFFGVVVFCSMIIQQVNFSYSGLYLDTLGAAEGVIGLSGALGSVTQSILMLTVMPHMLRRWGSERMILCALVLFGLRLGLWAAVPNIWVVALSEISAGFTFGSVLVAAVDYADRHAPTGLTATSQALMTGLISGLGRSVGGASAGALYDQIGPQMTFAVFAALCVAAFFVFGVAWRKKI